MTNSYKRQKSVLGSKHRDLADSLPCPAAVVSSCGKLIYRNRLASEILHSVRLGCDLMKRYSLPAESSIAVCDIDGKPYIVCARALFIDGESLLLYTLSPDLFGSADKFREYYFARIGNLSSISDTLIEKIYDSAGDADKTRKYIGMLKQNQSRLEGCRRLIYEYSVKAEKSLLRERDSFSLLAILGFVKDYLDRRLSGFGVTFDIDCPSTLVCFINPHDFSYVLVSIVNFALLYTKNRHIQISARAEGDDIVISAKIRDRYDMIEMYSHVIDGTDDISVGFGELFIPLGIINAICAANGRRAVYLRDGEDLVVNIHVKSSLTLPRATLKNSASNVVSGELMWAFEHLLASSELICELSGDVSH